MKKTCYPLLVLLLLAVCGRMQAKSLKVHVKQPGTLSALIPQEQKYAITELTLRGRLNGDDLKLLRDMAGSDFNEQETPGRLRRIDLSRAGFATGGGAYMKKTRDRFVESSGSTPEFLFRNTKIEEVILPEGMDSIGEGTFEHTHLRRIELPENAVVCDWAFNETPFLQEVIFPRHTVYIGQHALRRCPRLKEIVVHNIDYIPCLFAEELDSLERIDIRGWVVHMDGINTVTKCPRLRSIDFRGTVLTTGGAEAFTHCPQLEYVAFHAPLWSTWLGNTKGCAAFRGYITRDMVLWSQNTDYIARSPLQEAEQDSRYPAALKEALRIAEATENSPVVQRYSLLSVLADPLYREGTRLYRAGDKEKARHCFHNAVKYGYNNYENLQKDSAMLHALLSAGEIKALEQQIDSLRMLSDYIYILRKSAPYNHESYGTAKPFTYAEPSDSILTAVRRYFNLDSVAGTGDEISRIKNIMYFLHDLVRHDGGSKWPDCPYNAIDLYKVTQRDKRGLNCRFLAMMLNDMYLSMGFKSRYLTCQSRLYDTDSDCHVTNMVWSRTLHKWIWMDASFAAYITDENGLLLHQGEVRERIIKGLPLVLNEDANWNHQNKQTKEQYIDRYMAKNLYLLSARLRSESETEGYGRKSKSAEVTLAPEGFHYKWDIVTHNDTFFWQAPSEE